MTDRPSPREGPTPENMVSYSEQLLNLSIRRLTSLLEHEVQFTTGAGRELSDEFRSLRKALEIAYHERASLQKLKNAQAAGDAGANAIACLDLDAARDEVRRRLARLRATAGSDGVS